jgi:hypothetical protein
LHQAKRELLTDGMIEVAAARSTLHAGLRKIAAKSCRRPAFFEITLLERDLFRPCFASRSGLREGGNRHHPASARAPHLILHWT